VAYYEDLTEVPNTGAEAYVYRIKGSKKGTWYCRVKRNTSNGYFRKTLKTTQLLEAFKRANRHWMQVRDAEERDVTLSPGSDFRRLAQKWLKHTEERAANRGAWSTKSGQFKNYFIPYFGTDKVENITDKRYQDYLNEFRLKNSLRKKPKLKTLEQEQFHFNAFLRWAYENQHIRRQVQISPLRKRASAWIQNAELLDLGGNTRRELATYETYAHFRNFFGKPHYKHERIKEEPFAVKVNRMRASFYIKTIYNLCCRPGEELLLSRFQDFKLVDSNKRHGAAYIVLTVKHGKKINRNRFDGLNKLQYHSDHRYPAMLADWVRFLRSMGFPTNPDSFVFPLKKGRADTYGRNLRRARGLPEETFTHWSSDSSASFLRRQRPRVIAWQESKRKVSPKQKEQISAFTWYSVRHVSITRLITEGEFSLERVAEKANTGIDMIEQFYWKRLQNPEKRLVSRHPKASSREQEVRETRTTPRDDLELLRTMGSD
jgi:hypothetical protein